MTRPLPQLHGAAALKHGARAAQRAYTENKLDRRCGWVRETLAVAQELLADRGGAGAVDLERRVLIERIAFATVNLRMREAAATKEATDTGAPPQLSKDHYTAAESLRRYLLALRALDVQQQQKGAKTVDDWIEAEASADEDAA